MEKREPTREELFEKIRILEERLREAEQTIEAIQGGEVDALVVHKSYGERHCTLTGDDYRVLIESIAEGALILSSDDSIHSCNRTLGEMLGLPIQKIISRKLDSYVASEGHPQLMELIRDSRSFGAARGELLMKRDDGTLLPVKVSLNRMSAQGFDGVCALITDLTDQKQVVEELKGHRIELEFLVDARTADVARINAELQQEIIERRRAEEDLRKGDSRFRSFFNLSLDGIFSVNPEGRFLSANPAVERISGYTEDELCNLNFLDICAPEYREETLASFEKGITAAESNEIETALLSKDRRIVNVLIAGSPILVSGRVEGLFCIARDVTEQKKAEETLRTTVQRFHTILSNIFSGILVVTEDDRIEFANQNLCDQFDIPEAPSDLIGLTAKEILQKVSPAYADPDANLARIQQILSQNNRVEDEEILMRNGRMLARDHIPILVDGKPHGRMWQHRDITERKLAEEALRDSDTQLRTILENLTEGVVVSDMDARLLYWNHAALEMHGFSGLEECLRPLSELFPKFHFSDMHGNNIEFDQLPLSRIIRGEKLINWELRAERTDLEWQRVFSYCGNLAYDGQGNPLMAIVTISDITERKRAEEELRKTEQIYRAIGESIDYGVWVCAPDGKNTYASESFLKLVGITQEQCSDFGWGAVLHPEDAERTIAAWQECVHTEGRWNIEHRFLGVDGQWHPILARGVPIRDEAGEIVCWAGINLDISERKRAEENVAHLAAIVESSDDAIIGKTLDGEITTWNRAAEEIYGYTAEEVIGQSISLLAPHDRHDEVPAIIQRISCGEDVKHYETLRRRKDGRNIDVSLTVSAIRDASGKIIGASTIARDITERKRAETELRESQSLLRAVTEGSPDPIFVKDRESRIIMGNPALLRVWGKSLEDVVGKNDRELYEDPAIGEAMLANDGMVLQSGTSQAVEEVVPTLDGLRTYLSTKTPYRNSNGEIVGILGIARDITERKQMEEELRKSRDQLELRVQERTADLEKVNDELLIEIQERRRAEEAVRASEREFRLLADAMPQIVWITRPDGWNIYFNQRWLDYTGQTLEESYGHGWNKPFHPDDQKRAWDAWQNATKNGAVYDLECRLRRADGVYRWWLIRGVPVLDERGTVLKWFGTCTDIDDRKRNAEKIEAERQRFYEVLETLPVYICLLTPDYHVPFANRVFRERFGESTGLRCFEHLFGRSEPCEVCETYKVLKTMAPHQWEWTGPDSRNYSVFDFPFEDTDGSSLILEMGIDITERKQAEAELTATVARLELVNAELQEFAFVASHDLQEPLRKIQTFCDMAQKRCAPVLDSTGKEYLDRVVNSASRMRLLLRDLLEFSRVATRPEPFQRIDLVKIAREAADVFEASVKETGCQIKIESIPVIEADESQMLRLFQNLIGNALKFHSGETPLIRVYGKLDRKRICEIFVQDNGIGFDPQFAERIFKPFQRLHRRDEYDGTGMGLAICRKIVERHGGSIRAESEPGKGSTFIIRLPVKQDRWETYSD
jgi:PAS domain S-box-containing protein